MENLTNLEALQSFSTMQNTRYINGGLDIDVRDLHKYYNQTDNRFFGEIYENEDRTKTDF